MLIALLENDQILKVDQLQNLYPGYQFPDSGPDSLWLAERSLRLVNTSLPHDPATQRLDTVLPYITDNIVYNVVVTQMSEYEIQLATEAQATVIREKRNQLLLASDWTQLLDSPVDQTVWASYRQQLRDISLQENFPWVVTWPEPPF